MQLPLWSPVSSWEKSSMAAGKPGGSDNWRLFLLLSVAALIPLSCGMIFGFYGVDTNYHLGSWVDLARDWKSGVLLPGWAANANYGLGDIRFLFYPPVSLLLGGWLYLLLPHRLVMGALFALTFIGSGFAMRKLARRMLDSRRSDAAAVLYSLSFYLVITALKHSAVAELMVDALLPLIVDAYLDVLAVRARAWLRLGGLLALAWLTDVPVAIAIAYTLVPIAMVLAFIRRKGELLTAVLGAEALSILLSAVYLLPAFLEQKTIQSAGKLEFKLRTLFVSHGMLDVTLSAQSLGYGVILGWLFFRWRKHGQHRELSLILAMALIAFVLQLPLTDFIWLHAPELRIVGFPHRFQVFLALAFPLAMLSLPLRRSAWTLVVFMYVLLAFSPIVEFAAWVHRDGPRDNADTLVRRAMAGYVGTPEYLTRGTGSVVYNSDNKAQLAHLPPVVVSSGACTAKVLVWQPELHRTAVRSSGCVLTFKLFDHPFWSATVDGGPVSKQVSPKGMLEVAVPPGDHIVQTAFHRPLRPMLAGLAVSLGSLAALCILWFRDRRKTCAPV